MTAPQLSTESWEDVLRALVAYARQQKLTAEYRAPQGCQGGDTRGSKAEGEGEEGGERRGMTEEPPLLNREDFICLMTKGTSLNDYALL